MAVPLRRRISILFFALAAMISGCSSSDTSADSDLEASESATLTVRNAVVQVEDEEVPAGETIDVEPGDRLESLEDGRGRLVVPGLLQADILRKTEAFVPDMTSSERPSLQFIGGQIIIESGAEAEPFDVETGNRTLRAVGGQTKFAICQDPDNGATCLYVFEGSVDWTDPYDNRRFRAGEGTFAANRDEGPQATRCGTDQDMDSFLVLLLEGGQEALPDRVGMLPVGSCEGLDGNNDDVAQPDEAQTAGDETQPSEDNDVTGAADTPTLPSPEGMVEVSDGELRFHVDEHPVTNTDFREWVSFDAKNDPERWEELVPAPWLVGFEDRQTQATYPDGEGDLAVRGVTWDSASEYCRQLGKGLVTETQWAVAATAGKLQQLEDEAQDWVREWEAFAESTDDTEGKQVLRGNDRLDQLDLDARVFVTTDPEATAVRKNARIRCSADEVSKGGRSFSNSVVDDFTRIQWPVTPKGDFFELDYHSDPAVYHLDIDQQHSHGVVAKTLPEPMEAGRIDLELFVEREFTGPSKEQYRFGAVVGDGEQLWTLTVQPDEAQGGTLLACFLPLEQSLAGRLGSELNKSSSDEGVYESATFADNNHYGEKCNEAGTSKEIAVQSIDDPIDMSVVAEDGKIQGWVNAELIEEVESVQSIDSYGMYNQIFHRPRAHVHYDKLTISTE